MTQHNGPDGPRNDRTGNDAVDPAQHPDAPRPDKEPQTPEAQTPQAAAPEAQTPETAGTTGAEAYQTDEGRGTSRAPGAHETRGPRDAAASPTTPGSPTTPHAPDATDTTEVFELGGDELALRRLLQGAVGGLEPTEGALDHLRRAVPARRARKRQALVGAAAAVILLGTGVPAAVHVAGADTASDANAINAGHGAQVQGGTGDDAGPAGEQAAGSPSGELSAGKGRTSPSAAPPSAASGVSDGVGGAPDASPSSPAKAPVCEAGQLAVSAAEAGGPGEDGAVYGTFRITNVSGGDCTVDAGGTVGFGTSGAADPGRISVVRHGAGSAASGLPAPSSAVASLVLKPSGAYEVRFAWVPSETCPVSGGSGGSGSGGGGGQSPEPTPSQTTEEPPPTTGGTTTGTPEGGGADAGPAVEPQTLRADGHAEGSVTVTHTPSAGGPTATVTVPNACAGTIYRTGLLPAG
ncbi:hypothetical protein [Streptomyces fradiae]|uniref:hypothetical protein n=1 Tax=Streptomyces fradiae TaxID=1906 RepID=UPI0029432FC3|nr:hypothetical protein [Streptomyces fradiae]WOI63272.1 hypothetical protein RYQ63_27225 [Streptomyces fradiae]